MTKYKYTNNEIYDVPANSSAALTQLEGTRNISELGYSMRYNTLDNMVSPSNGTLLDFSQDLAGLGGDVKYLRTEVSGNYYKDFATG